MFYPESKTFHSVREQFFFSQIPIDTVHTQCVMDPDTSVLAAIGMNSDGNWEDENPPLQTPTECAASHTPEEILRFMTMYGPHYVPEDGEVAPSVLDLLRLHVRSSMKHSKITTTKSRPPHESLLEVTHKHQ